MSKILKKERVILNDGKYTIPVSSNPAVRSNTANQANQANRTAGVSDEKINADKDYRNQSVHQVRQIGNVNQANHSTSTSAEEFVKTGAFESPDTFDTSDSEYSGYPETDMQNKNRDSYAIADDFDNLDFQDTMNNMDIMNNPDMQNVQVQQNPKTATLIDEEIIAQSHKTAELIINHALESAKRELDSVVSQGYKDGYEDGKEEALKIIEPSLLIINILADSIKKMQDKMLEEFQSGMFNIISEISHKILHKEIDEKDEYLVELFADAVKNIKAEGFVTVTISGAQIDFAMRNIDLFRAEVANISDFKIIPDKKAGKGTMVVETANSLADASYTVQQEKIDAIISQMRDNLTISNAYQEIAEDMGLNEYDSDEDINDIINLYNNESRENETETSDNIDDYDYKSNIGDINGMNGEPKEIGAAL